MYILVIEFFTLTAVIKNNTQITDGFEFRQSIDEVFHHNIDDLHWLFRNPKSLHSFANKMIQAGLVSEDGRSEPTVDIIIDEFTAGIQFISEQEKIEEHCIKFLSVLYTKKGSLLLLEIK